MPNAEHLCKYSSKMERFVIIINGWKSLTILTKCSILDVATTLDLPLLWRVVCPPISIFDSIFCNKSILIPLITSYKHFFSKNVKFSPLYKKWCQKVKLKKLVLRRSTLHILPIFNVSVMPFLMF